MNATASVTTISPARRKAIAAAINAENRNFDNMTASEKRVAIAKDVISQLSKGKHHAKSGVYIQLEKALPSDRKQQLIDVFADPEMPSCNVCARGAMFCSAVRKFNDCTVGDVNGSETDELVGYNFVKYEKKFFSRQQISLIESAFEGEPFGAYESRIGKLNYETHIIEYSGELGRAIEFGRRYVNDGNRMVAIMKNIIKNNGTFKP